MISKLEGRRIHLVFDIGEYNPKVIDLLTVLDIASKSKAADKDIEKLSEDITHNWWIDNKKDFLGESNH